MKEVILVERQYILFRLNEYEFLADILEVDEIIDYSSTTYVPNAPLFVMGIIENRGNLIPVVDLKKRFSLKDEYDDDKKIVLITIEDMPVGILVDDVAEIITLEDETIKKVPDLSIDINNKYIMGSAEVDGKLLIMLDFKKILTKEETDELKNMSN